MDKLPVTPLDANLKKTLEQLSSCSPLFQALGDPVRQQIITQLIQYEKLNVTQLAERVPMSRPTISHHLKILRQAHIVSSQKAGTEVYYSLEIIPALNQMKQLIHAIEENCL